jgi:glycosyltransferase involved in cell wall biosynthesis
MMDALGTAMQTPAELQAAIKYSIVIPLYNEAQIVEKLYHRIVRVMRHIGKPYEIVFINDGSTDQTPEIVEGLVRNDENVVLVDLRRNFTKAIALQAGFDHAHGEFIITMDGDLQHDPYEIPLFIRKLDEGYDIASGWRVRRGDNLWVRRIPSKIANKLLAYASGVEMHDFGGGYKAYRADVLKGVRLYGDMHRFIPAICARLGARICEVPIKNVRRPAGKSNYGIARTFRVALDILMLRFISGYFTRPLHFFGKWGLVSMGGGAGILAYLAIRKLVDSDFSIMRIHGPLMALGFMLVAMGTLFLATGLIGELLMRIYFESTSAKTYAVRRLVRRDAGNPPPPATERRG